MSSRRLPKFACSLIAYACYACTPAAHAQSTLTVTTRLVSVPAIVRDKHGALVSSLTRDNFTLTIDGKDAALRYFDHDTEAPLSLGLLVDTSRSQRGILPEERTASSAFVDSMPSTHDEAFVIQFDAKVELLQDATADHSLLEKALTQIDPSDGSAPHLHNSGNDQNQGDNSNPGDGGHHHGGRGGYGGGTKLFDAVYLASGEEMPTLKGRRALILLTDGGDNGSYYTIDQAIEAAQRADTVVYAIYYSDPDHDDHHHGGPGGFGGPGGGHGGMGGGHFFTGEGQWGGGHEIDGHKVLQRMTTETGGRLFEVSKKQTVADIYQQIGDELRAQYRLGFTPAAETVSGYHRLDVTLKNVDKKEKYKVQAREGYWSAKPASQTP